MGYLLTNTVYRYTCQSTVTKRWRQVVKTTTRRQPEIPPLGKLHNFNYTPISKYINSSWICLRNHQKMKHIPFIDSPSIGFPMGKINSIIFSKSKIIMDNNYYS